MDRKRAAFKTTCRHAPKAAKVTDTKAPRPTTDDRPPPDYDRKIKFPITRVGTKLDRHFTNDERPFAVIPYLAYKGDISENCASDDVTLLFRYVQKYQSDHPSGTLSSASVNPPFEYYQRSVQLLFDPTIKAFPDRYGDRTTLRLIAGRLSHTHPMTLNEDMFRTKRMVADNPGRAIKALAASQFHLGSNFSTQTPITSMFPSKALFNSKQPAQASGTVKIAPGLVKPAPPVTHAPVATATVPNVATAAAATAPTVTEGPLLGRPPDSSTTQAAVTVPASASTPPTEAPFTPVPTAHRARPNRQAALPSRRYIIRMRYKFTIPKADAPPAGSTPRSHLQTLVTTVFAQLLALDPTIVLLPWALNSTDAPYATPTDMPLDTSSQRWTKYAHNQSTPRFNDGCWLMLCWAYDAALEEYFTSYGTNKTWFTDGHHTAYPCVLHDSDDELDIGYFRWSGDFIDPDRLLHEFHLWNENYFGSRHRNYDQPIIAFRVRSHKRLEFPRKDKNKVNFAGYNKPAPDKALTVYCHKPQAQTCKNLLKRAFNNDDRPYTLRPGLYDISYVGADCVSQAGHTATISTSSKKVKEINVKQDLNHSHRTHLASLSVFEVDSIRSLDTPVTIQSAPDIPLPLYLWSTDGTPPTFPCKLTLRQVLMRVPYPLPAGPPIGYTDPDGGLHITKTADRLFNSIDRVQKSFTNKDQHVIRYTVHNSRADLAAAFIGALPSWIETFFHGRVFRHWMEGDLTDLDDETFHFSVDDNGIWDGYWTSSDDNDLASNLQNMPVPCSDIVDMSLVTTPGATTDPFSQPQRPNVAAFQPADHATLGEQTSGTAADLGPKNAFKNAQDDDSLTIRKEEVSVISEVPTAFGDRTINGEDVDSSIATRDNPEPMQDDDSNYTAPTAFGDRSLVQGMEQHHLLDRSSSSTEPPVDNSVASEDTPVAGRRSVASEHGSDGLSSRYPIYASIPPLDDMEAEFIPEAPDPREEQVEQMDDSSSSSPTSSAISAKTSRSLDKTPQKANTGSKHRTRSKHKATGLQPGSSVRITRHAAKTATGLGTAPPGASAGSNDV